MLDLMELRKEIDGIDKEIVRLYQKRMEISKNVAKYKIETGKKVFDREREKEKLKTLTAFADNEFNEHGIQELFEQIISMSRKLQYQLLEQEGVMGRLPFIEVAELDYQKSRIVYPGTDGAYSQAAMHEFFGEDINSFHVKTFREAMEAIEEGSADYAVLPIENSTAGIVTENYDLLAEFENYIVGEQIIKVDHCLLGLPGTKEADITAVFSHPQGLMQCSRYLDEFGWQQISLANTSIAAKKIFQDKDKSQAAIASSFAGKLYGLDIIREGINDSTGNSTRFIIVTNQKIFKKGSDKISIFFELPLSDRSGSLYHMLSHFIYNNINMTKIESRPIEGRNWEYAFFIDFDGNLGDSSVKNALRGLREEARNLRILGNY